MSLQVVVQQSELLIFLVDHEVQKIDWSLITRDSCMPDKISVECCIQGSIVKTFLADFEAKLVLLVQNKNDIAMKQNICSCLF